MTSSFVKEAFRSVSLALCLTPSVAFAQEPTPHQPPSVQPPADVLPDLAAPLDLSVPPELPVVSGSGETNPEQESGLQEMMDTRYPGFMGGRDTGYTSRFAPDFNPAIALVMDTVADFSEQTGSTVDGLDLRSVELNFASQIDPLGWAYLVTAFENDQFSLEEAAFLMNRLPANMTLRVGRFLSDFDKWNTLHEHDLNYVFQDGVRGSFFGGNLRMTGVEIHQFTGIAGVPVRWSLGVGSDFRGQNVKGDGLPVAGHTQDFLSGTVANRGFNEYGYTLHVTAQDDFGQNGFFQYGFAVFHTPDGLLDQLDPNLDGLVDFTEGRSQTTGVLDFTLRSVDASAGSANTTSLQIWHNQRETLSGVGPFFTSTDHGANGVWGFSMHEFNPYWAVGAMASWWQSATNLGGSDFFVAADSGAQRAVFTTWKPSPFNRLRLQLSQDVPVGGAPFWSLALQWDVILGAHSHPMDW